MGLESTASPESAHFTVVAGNIPQVTLPPLPSGVASINIYLSPVGGASGSEVQYATGVTATSFNLSAVQAGSIVPPATVTFSVGSTAGIQAGQQIIVDTELASITAVSGANLTVASFVRPHASSANVYLVEQAPSATLQLANPSGAAYAINTVYSKTLYLPTSKFVYVMANLDTVNQVTIEATLDLFTAIQ